MVKVFKKIFKCVSLLCIFIFTLSCSSNAATNINLYDPNLIEPEVFEYENTYFESFEDEVIFYDNIEKQMVDSEKLISDLVEHEFYITEEIISEDFSEKLYASLPEGFVNYDIDWEGVLNKFAIGTAVIVFAGIATISSLHTPVAYIFATAFKEGLKQALIGGTISGIINSVVSSIKADTFDINSIGKYFIDGFADGFMWGAISGTVTGFVKGAVAACKPGNYFSNDGTNLLGRIDDNNNFYNPKGEFVGKSIKGTNGNTYIVDTSGKVVYMFGENSLSQTIVNSYSSGLSIIKKPSGRYSGGNLTVNGKQVYKGGKLIGELNEVGNVIGVNEYKGMLICSIDANGYSTANYLRAINSGIVTDCYGNIVNPFIKATNPKTLVGGAQIVGSFILNNGDETLVIFDGTNRYLMDISNKILGLLDDALNIQSGWNDVISSLANSGVKVNKQMIIKMIQNNIPYDYGPSFTDDAIAFVQQYGKFPNGFQGHHINNVANYPWLANNPNNIQFYSYEDHLLAHNGKWGNSTHGDLKSLVEFFTSIFGGI